MFPKDISKLLENLLFLDSEPEPPINVIIKPQVYQLVWFLGHCVAAAAVLVMGLKLIEKLICSMTKENSFKETERIKEIESIRRPMGVDVDNKCTRVVANALIGFGHRGKDLLKKGKGVKKRVEGYRSPSHLLKENESQQNPDTIIKMKREPVPIQKTEDKREEKMRCANKKVISSTVPVHEKTVSEIPTNLKNKQALPASKIETDNYPSLGQLDVREPLESQTEQMKKSCIVSMSHSHAVENQNLKKSKKKSMSVSFNPSLEEFEKSMSTHKLCSSHAMLDFLTDAPSGLVHNHAMRILGAGEPGSRHRGRNQLGPGHKKSEEISLVSPPLRTPTCNDKEQVTSRMTESLSLKGDERQDIDIKTSSLRSIFSRSKGRRQNTHNTFSSSSMDKMRVTSSRSADSDVDVCKSSGYFCLLTNDTYFKSDTSANKRTKEANLGYFPLPPSAEVSQTYTISSSQGVTTDEKHWDGGNREVFYKTSDDTLKLDAELETHFHYHGDAVASKNKNSRTSLIDRSDTTEIPVKKHIRSHNFEEIDARHQSNHFERFSMWKYGTSDREETQANNVKNNVREPANIKENDRSISYHVREPPNYRENDRPYHVRKPANITDNDVSYPTLPFDAFSTMETLKGILSSHIPEKTIFPKSVGSQGKERPEKSREVEVECTGRRNKEVSFKSYGQDCKKSRLTTSNASLVSECQESIRMVESLLLSKESESPGCSGDSFTLDMQELSRTSPLPTLLAQQLNPRDRPKKVPLNAGIDNFSLFLHPYPRLSSPKILYSEAASSSSSSYKLETGSLSTELSEDKSSLTHLDKKADGSATGKQSLISTDTIMKYPSPLAVKERPLETISSTPEWYKKYDKVKSMSGELQPGNKGREQKRSQPEKGSTSPFQMMLKVSKIPMRSTLILCSAGMSTEFEQLDSMVSQSPGRVYSLKNRKRSRTFPSLQSYLDQNEKGNKTTIAPLHNSKRAEKVSGEQKQEYSAGATSVSKHTVDKPQQGRERSGRQQSFKSKPTKEIQRKEDNEIISSVTAKNVHFESKGNETRDIEGSRMIPHFGMRPNNFVPSSSTSSSGQCENVGYSKVKETRLKGQYSPFVSKPVLTKQAKSCIIDKKSQMACSALPEKLPKSENIIAKTNKTQKVAKFDVRNWKKGVLKNMKRDLDKKVGRRPKTLLSETDGNGGVTQGGQAGFEVGERNTDGSVDECSQPNLPSQAGTTDVKYLGTSEADFVPCVSEETGESSALAFPNADGESSVMSKLSRSMESRLSKRNKCFPVAKSLMESLYEALKSENREYKMKSEAAAKSFSTEQSKAKVSTSFKDDDQLAAEVSANKPAESKCVHENESMIPSQAICETNEQEFNTSKDQHQTLDDETEKSKTPIVSSDFHSRFPVHMPSRSCKIQRTMGKENCIVNMTEISAGSPCDNDSSLVTQNTPSPDLKSTLERAKTVLKQPSPTTKRRTNLTKAKSCGQQTIITSKADLECLCTSLPTADQGKEEKNKYEVHKVRRASDSLSNISVTATLEKCEPSFTSKKNSYNVDIEKEALPSYTSKYKATEGNTLKFSWRGTLAFRKRFQYLMEHNKDMASKMRSQRKIQVNGVRRATNIPKNKLDKKVDPEDQLVISPNLQLQLGNKNVTKMPVSQMTSAVSFDRFIKANARQRSSQGQKSPLCHEIVHTKDDKCLCKLTSKQPAAPKAQANSTHKGKVTKKYSNSFKAMSSPRKPTLLARKVTSEKQLYNTEEIPSVSTINQINKKKFQRKAASRSTGKHKQMVRKMTTVSEKSKVSDRPTETISINIKTSPNSLARQKSSLHDTDTKSQSPLILSREVSVLSVISSTSHNVETVKDIEHMVSARRTERSQLPISGESQGNEISFEGEEKTNVVCDHVAPDVKEKDELPALSGEAPTKSVWFSTENNSQILPSEKIQENSPTCPVLKEDSSNLSPAISQSSVNIQFHDIATGPNTRISRVRSDLRHLLKAIKTRRNGTENKNGDETIAVTDSSRRKREPNKKESSTGNNYETTLTVSKEKQDFQMLGSPSLNKATFSRFKSNNDSDSESKPEKSSITKDAITGNVCDISTESTDKHQDVANIENVFQRSGTIGPAYVVNKKEDDFRNTIPPHADDSNLAGVIETATIPATKPEAVATETVTERQTYPDMPIAAAAHAEVIHNKNTSPETKRTNFNSIDGTIAKPLQTAFTTQLSPTHLNENEVTKGGTLQEANVNDKMLAVKESNVADTKELRKEMKESASVILHVSHTNMLESQTIKSATKESPEKKASCVEVGTNSAIYGSKDVIPNVAATTTETEQRPQMVSQVDPRLAFVRTELQSESKNVKNSDTQAVKSKDVGVSLKKSLRKGNVFLQNVAAVNTHYQKKLPHENTTKASLQNKISDSALTGVKPVYSLQRENKQVIVSFYRPFTTKPVSKTKSCPDITAKKSQSSLHHRMELVKSKLQTGKIHNKSAGSESKRTQLKSPSLPNIQWKFIGIPEDICTSDVKQTECQENDKLTEAVQVYEEKDDGKDNEFKVNLMCQIEKDSKEKHSFVHPEKADKFRRRSVLIMNPLLQEDNKIKQTVAKHVLQTTTDARSKHSSEKHVHHSKEECTSRQIATNQTDKDKQGMAIDECDTTEENKIKNNRDENALQSHTDAETLIEKDTITNCRVSPVARNQIGLENVQGYDCLPDQDRKGKPLSTINENISQHSLFTTSNEVSKSVKTRSDSPYQTKRDTEVSCCWTPSQVEEKLCTSGYNTADVSSTSLSQLQHLCLHNLLPKKYSMKGSAEDDVHAKNIALKKLKNVKEEESSDASKPFRKQILQSHCYHQAEGVKKTDLPKETINTKKSLSASKKEMNPTFSFLRENKNNRGNYASSSSQLDKIEEEISGLKAVDRGTVVDVAVIGRKTISPHLHNQESRSSTSDLVSKVSPKVEEEQGAQHVGLTCDVTEKVPIECSNVQRTTQKGKDDVTAETEHTVESRGEKSDQSPLPAVVKTIKVFNESNDCNALVKNIKKFTCPETGNKEFADSHVREEKFDAGKFDTLGASEKGEGGVISQTLFEPSENSKTDALIKTLSTGVKTTDISATETHGKNKHHQIEVTSSGSTQDSDENFNRIGYTKSSRSGIGSIKLNTIQTGLRDTVDRPIKNQMKLNEVDKKDYGRRVTATRVRHGNQSEKQVKGKEETLDKVNCLESCHDSDSTHSLIQKSQNVFQSKFTKYVGVRRRRYLIENICQGETSLRTKTEEHTISTLGSHISHVAKQEEAFSSPVVSIVTSPVESKKSPTSLDDKASRYLEDKNETSLDLDDSHKHVESQKSEKQQNTSPPQVRKRTLKYRKSGSCQSERQMLNTDIPSGHDLLKPSWKRDNTFITRASTHVGNEDQSEIKNVSDIQMSLNDKTSEKDSKLPSVPQSGKDSKQTLPSVSNKTSGIKKTTNEDNKMLNLMGAHDGAVPYQPIPLKRRKLKAGEGPSLEGGHSDKSKIEITHSIVDKSGGLREDLCRLKNRKSHKIPTSNNEKQSVLEGQRSPPLKVLVKVAEAEAEGENSCHIALDTLSAHPHTNVDKKESFATPKAGTPSLTSDDLESILNIELKKTSDPKKSIHVPERLFSGVPCNKKRTRRVRQINQVSSLASNKEDSQYLRETHGPPESSASISSLKSTQSTASGKTRPSHKQRVPISYKRITKLDDLLQKVEGPILANVLKSNKNCPKASTLTRFTQAREADEHKCAEVGQVFKSRVDSEVKESRPQHRSTVIQVSKTESHTTSTVPKSFTEFNKPIIDSSIKYTPFSSKNKSQMPDKTRPSETTVKAVQMEGIVTGSEPGIDGLLQTKCLDSRPTAVETKDEKENKTSRNLTGVDEKDMRKEESDQMCEKTNFVEKPAADNDVKETLSPKGSPRRPDSTKEIMKTSNGSTKSGTQDRDIIEKPEVNKINADLNIPTGEDLMNATAVPLWTHLQNKASEKEEKNASSSSSSIVLSWIGSDALEYDEPFLNTASNFPDQHCNAETPEKKRKGNEAGVLSSPLGSQVVNNMKKEEPTDSEEFSSMRKFSGLSKVWEGAKSRFRNLVTSPKKKRKRIAQASESDLESDTGNKNAVVTTCHAPGEFRQTYIGDDISSFFHSDKNYNKAQDVKSIISLPVNISDDSSNPRQPKQSNDFYISNALNQGYSNISHSPEDVSYENDEDESWNFQRSKSFLSEDKSINPSTCLTDTHSLLFEELRNQQSYFRSPFENNTANEMYRNANSFEDIPLSPVDGSLRNDYVDSAFVYESTKRQSPVVTGLRFRKEDDEPTPQEMDKRSSYSSFGNGHSQHRPSFKWSRTQMARGLGRSDWPEPSETLNGCETNLLFENPRKNSTPKHRPRQSTCEGRKNRKVGQCMNQTTEYEKKSFNEKKVRFDPRSGTPSIPRPSCRWKSRVTRAQNPITRMSLEQHLIAMAGIQENRNDPPSMMQRRHEGDRNQKPQVNKDPKMVPRPRLKKPRKKVSLEQHLSTRSDKDGPQVNDSSTEQQGSNNDASKSTSSHASINWYKPQSLPSPASVTVVHENIPQRESSRATFNEGSSQALPSQWRRTRMPSRQRLEYQTMTNPILTPTATARTPPTTNVPNLMLSSFRISRDLTFHGPQNDPQVLPRQPRGNSTTRSPESCAKTVSKIVEMFEKIRDT